MLIIFYYNYYLKLIDAFCIITNYLKILFKSFWLYIFCYNFLIIYLYINNKNKKYLLYISIIFHNCYCLLCNDIIILVVITLY